jgi:L-iditol 2-dehydrogenase
MKAVVKMLPGEGHMEYTDIPEPQVTGDLVKIKIAYSGICGTDIHAMRGTYPSTKPPVVLGHEFSGVVVAVGENVRNIHVGDRVTSETTYETCGSCHYCHTGDLNLCGARRGVGTNVNGSMAEYVVNHEARIHVLPENVNLLAAALTEPLACGVHAVIERGHVHKGDIVCVFGAGAIGQMVAQVAHACGATVIMAGLSSDVERLQIATQCGIQRTVDQQAEELSGVISEMTNGLGVDLAFECSGAVPAANKALEIVKKGGKVIQMGVFSHPRESIATDLILHHEIQYMGSRSQKPSSWKLALELMAKGNICPEKIVTNIVPLKNWQSAFDLIASGQGCKGVIQCCQNM